MARSQESASTSNDKINDLADSPLRKRFFDLEFVPENNNAISCIRISGKKQEAGASPVEQKELNIVYAKREQLTFVAKPYSFTETASKPEKRKQFHKMLEDIRASQNTSKPIKHLIFSFQSRSNRNRFSARELEDLVDLGVTLHFARDNRKLTSKADISQWLMWHMENMKNAAYIDELTKNAMGGHIRCIERGIAPVSRPPFGFASEGRRVNRRFVLDGERARYMKRAFELVIVRQEEIARGQYSDMLLKVDLDREFKSLKKTPGKKQFCHLLRNPFYYGDFVYAGTIYRGLPEYHPALIDKDTWTLVQDILEGRHKKRRLSRTHPYIGLIKCGGKTLDEKSNPTEEVCGAAITAETVRRTYKNKVVQEFYYYRCSRADKKCSQRDKDYMQAIAERNVSYRESEVDEIFAGMFKSFSFDDVTCQRMKKYLWDEHFEQKKRDHEERERLQLRQRELVTLIDKSYEDKLKGDIAEKMWREKNQKWNTEHAKIVTELAALNDIKDEYMQRGVTLIELMQNADLIYKSATPEIKRRLVQLALSNLSLVDGTLRYDWRVPFNMLAIKGNLEVWLGD